MNNELGTLYKHINGGIRFYCQKDKDFLENIVQPNINRFEPFERPDIILPLEDNIFAIEHFEFDASNLARKESTDKRQFAERGRIFNNEFNQQHIPNEPFVSNILVNTQYSHQNYINNFKNGFENHVNKIEKYKENLVEKGKSKNLEDIVICFFVEETTPLGCYYLDDENYPREFTLFQVAECMDIIMAANKVNYMLFGFSHGVNNNDIAFLSNSQEARESLKKEKILDFKRDRFYTYNIREVRSRIISEE